MMPNTKRASLDNICLSSDGSIPSLFSSPQFREYLAAKEEDKKNKSCIISSFLSDLETGKNSAQQVKKLLKLQHRYAPSKSMRICNTIPVKTISQKNLTDDRVPEPSINITEYSYSFGGLNRCKNPYCVMCSRARASQRAEKLKQGIMTATERGYKVLFATFTIPRQPTIEGSKNEIRRRWKGMHRVFDTWRGMGETVYHARALDITINPYQNNRRYHLHIHSVIIIDGQGNIDDYKRELISGWISQNTKTSKATEKCQDIQTVSNTETGAAKTGRYIAKMGGLALEIGNTKAKSETKSALSISLSELIQGMETKPKYRAIYGEFLTGMKRVNTLNFSRNFDDLIEDDEDLYETEKFTIPVQKWAIVKPVIFDLAEKLYIECKLSKTLGDRPQTDYDRIDEIRAAWDSIMAAAEDTHDIEMFLYCVFD